jgi:pimeloyl-ACP methyl ester carboxylesterase
VLEQMLPRLVNADTAARRPEVVEDLRRMAAGQTSAGIIGALEAMRDRPDSGPSLAAITVPTLVVVGEQDAITPPAVARSLASHVRGTKLVTIPDAGHMANLEQPDRFSEAVRSFLQGLA